MPSPLPDMARVRAALQALDEGRAQGKGSADVAAELGMGGSTLRSWDRQYRGQMRNVQAELAIPPAPTEGETIEELIARKKTLMKRATAAEAYHALVPVTVADDKPIGVFLVGDPHVDDDHCDIERLEADLTAVGRCQGMYAGHVGDLTNNWVGRLAALYAHQSTTFSDGLKLTEWMLGLCPNLFVAGGNHDLWSHGMDLLRWIVKAGAHQPHGARMALRWGDGSEIRLHARHDFPGRSQYSDTHGMKREALFGHRDHILVAGHIHTDEGRVEPMPAADDATWMFRVSGYKVIDEYAKANHFRTRRLRPGVALVLQPRHHVPAERVKPYWDVDAAADYLTFLRRRK